MNFAGIQSRFSMMKKIPNIVIFASGSGSNAENIINWSKERKTYTVTGRNRCILQPEGRLRPHPGRAAGDTALDVHGSGVQGQHLII